MSFIFIYQLPLHRNISSDPEAKPSIIMAASFLVAALLATGAVAQQSVWGQCGGVGWSGATTCVSGSTCTKQNDYYYQCLPGGSGGGGGSPTTTTTTSSQPSTPTGGNGGGNTGKTQYFGVNIAGFVRPLNPVTRCNPSLIVTMYRTLAAQRREHAPQARFTHL